MEELLKEVALSERRRQQIDSFIETVTKLLQTVPDSPEVEVCSTLTVRKALWLCTEALLYSFCSHTETCKHISYSISPCVQVSDLSWLSSAVKVPFLLVPKTTKGKFHMAPPASIDLIGSYPLGTCTKPRVMVDLAVTIPAVSQLFFFFISTHHLKQSSVLLSCTECNMTIHTFDYKRHWCPLSAHLSVVRMSCTQRTSWTRGIRGKGLSTWQAWPSIWHPPLTLEPCVIPVSMAIDSDPSCCWPLQVFNFFFFFKLIQNTNLQERYI